MFESLTFELRNMLWGNIALRATPPRLALNEQLEKERRFYEAVLDRAGFHRAPEIEVVFDVGCRNWSYIDSVAQAFPNARLVGVELDGGRRYWNLYRRIEMARAFACELEAKGRSAECLHADFRTLDLAPYLRGKRSAAYCFFFPFVSERPCRKWGLPARFADFSAMLEPALKAPVAARVVSCHQGEWEAEIAREAYARLGLTVTEKVLQVREFRSTWPGQHDVYIFAK